ncbi:MAG: hypothetical protein JOZ46_09085 [Candidatus Dormibacteraeota bacterium]|nr:hypothetical protein [Candidatus Dormibacteraeota bacterium]MBV9525951.1 hypothetical protein [Candidatus Dormibacteraeota bacterium]
MANTLTDPPFAANPPVKLNVNAKILGLVLAILAVIGAVFIGLLEGLISVFAFAGGFQLIWGLGVIVGLIAYILAAIGGFQMYNLNRDGKRLVIYGIALGLLGALISLIGNIVAYSGIYALGYSAAGAIVGFIFALIIYGILYYLVVISRFPGEAPVAPSYGGGYGGTPPPPPPSV